MGLWDARDGAIGTNEALDSLARPPPMFSGQSSSAVLQHCDDRGRAKRSRAWVRQSGRRACLAPRERRKFTLPFRADRHRRSGVFERSPHRHTVQRTGTELAADEEASRRSKRMWRIFLTSRERPARCVLQLGGRIRDDIQSTVGILEVFAEHLASSWERLCKAVQQERQNSGNSRSGERSSRTWYSPVLRLE